MRVLIADDQKEVGKSLAELVSFCNHQIVGVVGSGLEAIQAYTQHHPDLVLMDYRMPKLNGTTALRNILSKDPAARHFRYRLVARGRGQCIGRDRHRAKTHRSGTAQRHASSRRPNVAGARGRGTANSQGLFSTRFDRSLPARWLTLPVVPPSLETTLPVDATTSHLQETGEVGALDEEKISGKRRSSQRRAQWSERDERHDRQSRKATRSSAAGAPEIPRARVH